MLECWLCAQHSVAQSASIISAAEIFTIEETGALQQVLPAQRDSIGELNCSGSHRWRALGSEASWQLFLSLQPGWPDLPSSLAIQALDSQPQMDSLGSVALNSRFVSFSAPYLVDGFFVHFRSVYMSLLGQPVPGHTKDNSPPDWTSFTCEIKFPDCAVFILICTYLVGKSILFLCCM